MTDPVRKILDCYRVARSATGADSGQSSDAILSSVTKQTPCTSSMRCPYIPGMRAESLKEENGIKQNS